MASQNAQRLFQKSVQIAANSVYAAMMKSPTNASFIAIRDCANSMPSTSANRPASSATSRRRKRMRASTYRRPAISAPAITPGIRQLNAC